jgi:hypothetical protein
MIYLNEIYTWPPPAAISRDPRRTVAHNGAHGAYQADR